MSMTMLGIEVELSSSSTVCERCLQTVRKTRQINNKTVCLGCAPAYEQELQNYYAWERQMLLRGHDNHGGLNPPGSQAA